MSVGSLHASGGNDARLHGPLRTASRAAGAAAAVPAAVPDGTAVSPGTDPADPLEAARRALLSLADAARQPDASGAAASVAAVQLATMVPAAAVCTLDGALLTADTNAIFLGPDGRIQVTLAARTPAEVERSIAPDAARIGAAVAALVRSYNAARGFFDGQGDRFPSTAAALRALGSRFRASLGSVGMFPGGDGTPVLEMPGGPSWAGAPVAVRGDALGGEDGLPAAAVALAAREPAAVVAGPVPPNAAAGYGLGLAVGAGRALAGRWPPRLFDGRA